jgi:hypothetical protein
VVPTQIGAAHSDLTSPTITSNTMIKVFYHMRNVVSFSTTATILYYVGMLLSKP